MRLLVLGANGLVGSSVVEIARDSGHEIVGTYHTEKPDFDVELEKHDIRDDLEGNIHPSQFDAVINCAAMTDVDGCERNPDHAMEVNGVAPGNIAAHCKEMTTPFVHLSTDYVFDGEANEPYEEDEETNPVQVYGETKLEGEKRVRENHPQSLMLRLSFVYGIHRSRNQLSGFPAWVVEKLRAAESAPLFTDQFVTPSRAGQVASTLLQLLSLEHTGTYHVACSSCVSPFEFGQEIASLMDLNTSLLEQGTLSDVNREAERPRYSCLSVSRLESLLERNQPTLREDLQDIADAI